MNEDRIQINGVWYVKESNAKPTTKKVEIKDHQITKFKELFAIVPLETLQKTVDGAAAKQPTGRTDLLGGAMVEAIKNLPLIMTKSKRRT